MHKAIFCEDEPSGSVGTMPCPNWLGSSSTAKGVKRMNGMLGTRGSLMLDLVAMGMILIVPVMAASIYLVRSKKQYAVHKRIQTSTAFVLLLVLIAFEVEMRVSGWRDRATASPLSREGLWNDPVEWSLLVHLVCAVPTLLLWVFVVFRAMRGFPLPPLPSAHSAEHRLWGRWAALGMTLTAITGFVFYYMAFVIT